MPKNVAQTFRAGKIIEICKPAKMWLRNSPPRKLLRFASLGTASQSLSEPILELFGFGQGISQRRIEKSKFGKRKGRKKQNGRNTSDRMHKGKNIKSNQINRRN